MTGNDDDDDEDDDWSAKALWNLSMLRIIGKILSSICCCCEEALTLTLLLPDIYIYIISFALTGAWKKPLTHIDTNTLTRRHRAQIERSIAWTKIIKNICLHALSRLVIQSTTLPKRGAEGGLADGEKKSRKHTRRGEKPNLEHKNCCLLGKDVYHIARFGRTESSRPHRDA